MKYFIEVQIKVPNLNFISRGERTGMGFSRTPRLRIFEFAATIIELYELWIFVMFSSADWIVDIYGLTLLTE